MKIIGSGWKMNKVWQDAREYASVLKNYLVERDVSSSIFLAPPFTLLSRMSGIFSDTQVQIAAQNMHWEPAGAYTGEISPVMLRDCGVQIVELGHFERRTCFGETDILINKKVLSAIQHRIRPLICVGEISEDKMYKTADAMLERQIRISLYGVTAAQALDVIIAYEPAWAIGKKGTAADPVYSSKIHRRIKKIIAEIYDRKTAESIPVIYGGSVTVENARDYLSQPAIDGLFIGRAALDPNNFIQIIETAEAVPSGKEQEY